MSGSEPFKLSEGRVARRLASTIMSDMNRSADPPPQWGTEVRITALSFEAVSCLQDALRDFWVTVDGRELVVATAEKGFKDGAAPILEAVQRCLEIDGIGPVTLEIDGQRYTM